jgi:hypothetical protein
MKVDTIEILYWKTVEIWSQFDERFGSAARDEMGKDNKQTIDCIK